MRQKLQGGKRIISGRRAAQFWASLGEKRSASSSLWSASQVLNSTPEQPSRGPLHRRVGRPPRLTRPKAWQASMQCQSVTAELHMQARRSRISFAGQRHAPHPSAMARRAAAALHKGDSSARSFPAALHDRLTSIMCQLNENYIMPRNALASALSHFDLCGLCGVRVRVRAWLRMRVRVTQCVLKGCAQHACVLLLRVLVDARCSWCTACACACASCRMRSHFSLSQ